MEIGFYLCGVTSQGNKEEKNLFNELYDKFSHNELSVHEVIQSVADFQGFDLKNASRFKESYSECISSECFIDGEFILSYDSMDGSYDVYLTDMGKKHYDELISNGYTLIKTEYVQDFIDYCMDNEVDIICDSVQGNVFRYIVK